MKTPRRLLAFVLAFVLVLGLAPVFTLPASAATVDYQYGSTEDYSNIIYNWGTRGELATFLSPNAEEFYETTSYADLSGLDGSAATDSVPESELYQALYTLMDGAHTTVSDYDDIKAVFAFTDSQDNGYASAGISGFYSGINVGSVWDGATWNREHTWPQSKASGGDDIEDIMSIRPESAAVNSSRGNKAYGESSGYYNPNSLATTVDVRGDVARVVLYTYVRWGGEIDTIQNKMWGTDGVIESVDVLLNWIEADPVDTWELGRNDSVQSITGTRNVFVDYPELAFLLFDETVPEMDTPSASQGSDFVTAQSSNASYGTVAVTGNDITAFPAQGYRASGYEIISGNATVTRAGDVFTVSATAACTVRILFEAIPERTVKFFHDEAVQTSQSVNDGNYIVLPAFSGTLPEGYTFLGWVTEALEDSATMPAAIYSPGREYVITGNTTFYALVSWIDAEQEGDQLVYRLVTQQSQIQEEATVIIASASFEMAMSTTQNGNNRGAVAVTKGTDTLIIGDTVQLFTLKAGTVDGSYSFYTGSGYLYAVNNSNNYLRTTKTHNEQANFYITVNSDGTCAVTSATYSGVPMQYNDSNTIFSCYPKATQGKLALYVGENAGAVCYGVLYAGAACTHTSTKIINAVEATCTEAGYSGDKVCTECGEVVERGSVIEEEGHDEYYVSPQAATLSQPGHSGYSYCTVCGDSLEQMEQTPALFYVDSWGLILGDSLTLRFMLYLDESIIDSARINVTRNGVTGAYAAADLSDADGLYEVTIHVAAPQMCDVISLQAFNGEDESEVMQYSVLAYANALLQDESQSQYHALVKEMLNYGGASQVYFGYKTDNLASKGLTDVAATEVPTSCEQKESFVGNADGISYYGASLMFRHKLAVRFYFTGDVSNITFTCGGDKYTPVAKDGKYYVEIDGILPQDIADQLVLTATDADGNTQTITYSPLNYIVRINTRDNVNTKNLMKALYNYYLAALEHTA